VLSKPLVDNRRLLVVAPFKGDALSLSKLLGAKYPVDIHHNLISLSLALGEDTGLVILTEECLW